MCLYICKNVFGSKTCNLSERRTKSQHLGAVTKGSKVKMNIKE